MSVMNWCDAGSKNRFARGDSARLLRARRQARLSLRFRSEARVRSAMRSRRPAGGDTWLLSCSSIDAGSQLASKVGKRLVAIDAGDKPAANADSKVRKSRNAGVGRRRG